MKNILLLATGGTIASAMTVNGLTPALSAEELLEFIPDITEVANLSVRQLFNLDSTNIDPSHWTAIVKTIKEEYDNYDGFVVTHGTDTMAYTAAAMFFMIEYPKKPIVITGSQRPITDERGDGASNLSDAIVAASKAPGGVYCVFDHKVMSAKSIRKVRTHDFNAFMPVNAPILALVEGHHLSHMMGTVGNTVFHEKITAKVGVLTLVPGLPARLLQDLAQDLDGIIIEAFGAGGIPTLNGQWAAAIEKLVKDHKPVVISTQVLSDGTHLQSYEVGVTALRAGALEAGMLTPEACFTALSLAISEARDYRMVKDLYASMQTRLI